MRDMEFSISLINKLREVMRVYSLRKVYNILMGTLQLRLRSSKLYYLPTRISIETGNLCNLRCPLCPTGKRETNISRGFMTFEDYTRIIDELRKDLILVRLYNWGEPLLNRSIIPMITYARDRGMSVHLSTNLNILDRQTAHDLLEAYPTKIFISCDGASADTYRKYHVGGDFDTVIGNMRLLLEEKKMMPRCHARVIWLFHVFRHNEHEVEKAVQVAESLGLEIRTNKMRTDMGKEIFEKARHSIARDIEWIPENPKYCAFDLEKNEVKKKRNFCALPWKDTVVNWDGAVLPCCSVCEEKYSFGNAFSDRFRDIWNGKAYLAARKELAGRPSRQKTVCHICKENEFTHF